MTPEEIDEVKHLLWGLSEEQTLDREKILELVKVVRRLLNAYQGSIKKQYRLRDRLRRKHDERSGH
tara:strand:- start:1234 stop:1431 length:198 start_codon:yes stop_codon:yes gene_type:complete